MESPGHFYRGAILQGLYGVMIGLLVPIFLTVALLSEAALPITWVNFWHVHFGHIAFALADSVPLIFGLLLAKIAMDQHVMEAQTKELDSTRKWVEERLNQWQVVQDNTSVAYAIMDREHNVIYGNRVCSDLAGLSQKEIQGTKCYESFGNGCVCPGCPVMLAFATGQTHTNIKKEINAHREEAIMELVAVPVIKDGQVNQVIEIVTDVTERMQLVDSRHEELLDTINTFVEIIELNDDYTGGHSHRVRQLALRTARALGLETQQLLDVDIAACLHDIGKVGLERVILNKPCSLTELEYNEVKLHPVVGAESLQKIPRLERAANYVRHHHETWDGAGYPDKLAGEAIPLGSRIICVADAYDAMTSDRSYRHAIPREQALAEIRAGSGIQFDPKVVSTFLDIMGDQRV